jgi:glutamyl-Q tRNA(Asp) synthetase
VTAEVTRFAPSPTGELHIGHALAARVAHDLARESGGRFLLRMEDIDSARCRPEYEQGICDDLRWLGLHWDGAVLRQSEHLPRYRARLDELTQAGLTYPCFCTRGEIAAEIAAMGAAPHGPDGPRYPGTCRQLDRAERRERLARGDAFAIRFDVDAALARVGTSLHFEETGRGPAGEQGVIDADPRAGGDIVLGRKDLGVSYHLAVVLDDEMQGVTLVTRGEDLFSATPVQRLLQAALGLRVPRYHHHRLVRDATGRRLAKRDSVHSLAALRAAGTTAAAVRARLAASDS